MGAALFGRLRRLESSNGVALSDAFAESVRRQIPTLLALPIFL
jgi:hypothetical protein